MTSNEEIIQRTAAFFSNSAGIFVGTAQTRTNAGGQQLTIEVDGRVVTAISLNAIFSGERIGVAKDFNTGIFYAVGGVVSDGVNSRLTRLRRQRLGQEEIFFPEYPVNSFLHASLFQPFIGGPSSPPWIERFFIGGTHRTTVCQIYKSNDSSPGNIVQTVTEPRQQMIHRYGNGRFDCSVTYPLHGTRSDITDVNVSLTGTFPTGVTNPPDPVATTGVPPMVDGSGGVLTIFHFKISGDEADGSDLTLVQSKVVVDTISLMYNTPGETGYQDRHLMFCGDGCAFRFYQWQTDRPLINDDAREEYLDLERYYFCFLNLQTGGFGLTWMGHPNIRAVTDFVFSGYGNGIFEESEPRYAYEEAVIFGYPTPLYTQARVSSADIALSGGKITWRYYDTVLYPMSSTIRENYCQYRREEIGITAQDPFTLIIPSAPAPVVPGELTCRENWIGPVTPVLGSMGVVEAEMPLTTFTSRLNEVHSNGTGPQPGDPDYAPEEAWGGPLKTLNEMTSADPTLVKSIPMIYTMSTRTDGTFVLSGDAIYGGTWTHTDTFESFLNDTHQVFINSTESIETDYSYSDTLTCELTQSPALGLGNNDPPNAAGARSGSITVSQNYRWKFVVPLGTVQDEEITFYLLSETGFTRSHVSTMVGTCDSAGPPSTHAYVYHNNNAEYTVEASYLPYIAGKSLDHMEVRGRTKGGDDFLLTAENSAYYDDEEFLFVALPGDAENPDVNFTIVPASSWRTLTFGNLFQGFCETKFSQYTFSSATTCTMTPRSSFPEDLPYISAHTSSFSSDQFNAPEGSISERAIMHPSDNLVGQSDVKVLIYKQSAARSILYEGLADFDSFDFLGTVGGSSSNWQWGCRGIQELGAASPVADLNENTASFDPQQCYVLSDPNSGLVDYYTFRTTAHRDKVVNGVDPLSLTFLSSDTRIVRIRNIRATKFLDEVPKSSFSSILFLGCSSGGFTVTYDNINAFLFGYDDRTVEENGWNKRRYATGRGIRAGKTFTYLDVGATNKTTAPISLFPVGGDIYRGYIACTNRQATQSFFTTNKEPSEEVVMVLPVELDITEGKIKIYGSPFFTKVWFSSDRREADNGEPGQFTYGHSTSYYPFEGGPRGTKDPP